MTSIKCKKCKRTVQPTNTFYKRLLPSTCIAFNSSRGKELFKQALNDGYLESYFSLSLQFLTQSEPAYCGIASLCMSLNALEIDPLREWKGVWRWYDETMLDCCRPLSDIKANGITLFEFVCLAKCNGLDAQLHQPPQTTKAQFLNDIKQSCKSPDESGDGHFSPIGGYNEQENMVLILDVARFKYPSYWVSFDLLWDSLFPLDSVTGMPRGYVMLSRPERMKTHAFCQLGINIDTWSDLDHVLTQVIPERLSHDRPASPLQFFQTVIDSFPPYLGCIVQNRALIHTCPSTDSDEPMHSYLQGLHSLLVHVSQTKLYAIIKKVKASKEPALGVCAIDDHSAFLALFFYTLGKFRPGFFEVDGVNVKDLVKVDEEAEEINGEVGLLLEQLYAISSSCCKMCPRTIKIE